MMNDIFWDLIVKYIMIMYLNNILILYYYRVVYRVLEILAEHNLSLHFKKCEYLDLVIFED